MANLVRENIDRWFEHNLDVDNRTLYMGSVDTSPDGDESGVDNFMTEYFVKGMHVLEAKNHNNITIIMNNPGGDWYHGMAIYDAIKMAQSHCIIKVYGHAMSMGSIILQAADTRIMMPNSRLMIHYGDNQFSNHTKILEKWMIEERRLCYEMENIYLKVMMEKEEKEGNGYLAKELARIMDIQKSFELDKTQLQYTFSKVTDKKKEQIRLVLKELLNFDTILTAEDAVALGFADEVYKRP